MIVYKVKKNVIDRIKYQQINNTQIPRKLIYDDVLITCAGNYYSIENAEKIDDEEVEAYIDAEEDAIVQLRSVDESVTLTPFDNDIMDILYTINLCVPSSCTHFSVTPEQIYKIYTGNKNKRIHENEYKRLIAALEKLRKIRMEYLYHPDFIVEDINMKLVKRSCIPYEDSYISWGGVPLMSYTKKEKAEIRSETKKLRSTNVELVFLRKFPLQQYSLAIGQSIHMNMNFLTVDSSFSLNEESITIIRYIARKVMLIRNANNKINNHMALWIPSRKSKGLLESLGYSWNEYENTWENGKIKNQYGKTLRGTNWKKKRREITSLIKRYLDFLIEKGYVKNYTIKRIGATDARNKYIVTYVIYPGGKQNDISEDEYYECLAAGHTEDEDCACYEIV